MQLRLKPPDWFSKWLPSAMVVALCVGVLLAIQNTARSNMQQPGVTHTTPIWPRTTPTLSRAPSNSGVRNLRRGPGLERVQSTTAVRQTTSTRNSSGEHKSKPTLQNTTTSSTVVPVPVESTPAITAEPSTSTTTNDRG